MKEETHSGRRSVFSQQQLCDLSCSSCIDNRGGGGEEEEGGRQQQMHGKRESVFYACMRVSCVSECLLVIYICACLCVACGN